MNNAWCKAGHRSLTHKGYPRFVVRFTRDIGKGKLLSNEKEFNQSEIAAGRSPDKTLETLVKDAERVWQELKQSNTERKNDR